MSLRKKIKTLNSFKGRLIIVSVIFLIFSSMVFYQLGWVQLYDGVEVKKIAENRGRSRIEIPPRRGIIYDRNAKPLVENLFDYVSLSVKRDRLIRSSDLIRDLSRVLKKGKEHFQTKLKKKAQNITFARKVSPEQAQTMRDLNWRLIEKQDVRRIYPYGRVGSQILGFLNVDDDGIAGMEKIKNNILKGEPGWRVVEVDVLGNPQIRESLPYQPAIDGGIVVLTIDIDIQGILQEELNSALSKHSAKSASGIIMDPRNGQILAISTVNDFDANFPNSDPVGNQKCRAVTDQFEVGSSLKPLFVAMLLENGQADYRTLIDTSPGFIKVHGKIITDSHNYGVLNPEGILVKSSNVGMIKLFQPISSIDIYKYFSSKGILEKNDIKLCGEVRGSAPKPEDWSGLTKPNVVIGQGIAITMLNLVRIYQGFANSGIANKPTIVKGIKHPDGRFESYDSSGTDRLFSPQIADSIRKYLIAVVDSGTGKSARIPGENIKIAGKTGTGLKPDLINGGYHDEKYFSNFLGFFPAENPCYLILILVDEPTANGYYASMVAAPVFSRVSKRILDLKPEIRRFIKEPKEMVKKRITLPNYCFSLKNDVIKRLKKDKLKFKITGKGDIVYDQTPPPGSNVIEGSVIQFTVGPAKRLAGDFSIVPRMLNHSLRDAVSKATLAGLSLDITGSGRVISQSLTPGNRVKIGKLCKLIANSN